MHRCSRAHRQKKGCWQGPGPGRGLGKGIGRGCWQGQVLGCGDTRRMRHRIVLNPVSPPQPLLFQNQALTQPHHCPPMSRLCDRPATCPWGRCGSCHTVALQSLKSSRRMQSSHGGAGGWARWGLGKLVESDKQSRKVVSLFPNSISISSLAAKRGSIFFVSTGNGKRKNPAKQITPETALERRM